MPILLWLVGIPIPLIILILLLRWYCWTRNPPPRWGIFRWLSVTNLFCAQALWSSVTPIGRH